MHPGLLRNPEGADKIKRDSRLRAIEGRVRIPTRENPEVECGNAQRHEGCGEDQRSCYRVGTGHPP